MLSEVEMALSLNYKILFIHEMHAYFESKKFLQPFVGKLNFLKLKASDCFKNCTYDEKIEQCTLINSRLQQFDKSNTISINDIEPNLRKRNFYKLMSNALFGKFLQTTNKPRVKYLNSQEELQQLFYSGVDINDISCINENLCLASVKLNEQRLPANRSQNVYIGSQITAYAREVIYKHLQTIAEVPGVTIYQIECDSLFFSLPKNHFCPLILSPCLGDFKNIYDGETTGFYSLGNKQYNLNYESKETNTLNSVFKISGLCLKNRHELEKVNDKTFESFLNDYVSGEIRNTIFFQSKTFNDLKEFKVLNHQQKYTLTNKLSRKRFFNVFNERLISYPFGFQF